MIREKVVPILWLMLAGLIIGIPVGFFMRADVDGFGTWEGLTIVPAVQCGPEVVHRQPDDPCFPYTPAPTAPPIRGAVGAALP